MTIRACIPDDIPAVARIFQKAHRDPRKPAPPSLEACLKELFFEHPGYDPDVSSRVYVAPDGSIAGYIGVVPLKMAYRGQFLRAAVPTHLAVEHPEQYPLAGATLVRSFLNGPQDISISEPANHLSVGMWKRLGGQSVASESMQWVRVLRPAGLALSVVADRIPFAKLARPLGRALDRLAQNFVGDMLRFDGPARGFVGDADASDALLLRYIPEFAAGYQLHPEWDAPTLQWMLDHASRNIARGPLFRRIVYGRNNVPLGCYLYQANPHGAAWVLQVLARPDAIDAVLDSLFAHAFSLGCVAIKGRTQLRLLDPLMRRHCLFYQQHSAVVHSRNPDLLKAVRSGDAMVCGLAAEPWMRLVGEKFH